MPQPELAINSSMPIATMAKAAPINGTADVAIRPALAKAGKADPMAPDAAPTICEGPVVPAPRPGGDHGSGDRARAYTLPPPSTQCREDQHRRADQQNPRHQT